MIGTLVRVIPWAILGASFLGSWHCAGMCGPIAQIFPNRRSQWAYHLGRLCGYILLGIFSAYIGGKIRKFSLPLPLYLVSISSLGILFTWQGISGFLSRDISLHIPGLAFLYHWLGKTILPLRQKLGTKAGFIWGLCSILLPCGWLYTAAAGTFFLRSPLKGGIAMALFWLTTLPAFIFLRALIKFGHGKTGSIRIQRIKNGLFVTTGLFLLFYVGLSLAHTGSAPQCHGQ